jgi:transposase
MFRFHEGLKVYLHREPIDFRLSINGLALLVERALGMDPFAACVYVFSNRRRNRVKILSWERNGFWLLLKRLEKDRFIWPGASAVPTLSCHSRFVCSAAENAWSTPRCPINALAFLWGLIAPLKYFTCVMSGTL